MRGGGNSQQPSVFWGSQLGQLHQQTTCTDVAMAIALLEYAHWAFVSYKMSDNGQKIAQAVANGNCEAVSDGSYKDSSRTAAWMIEDRVSKNTLKGNTIIPGHTSDQSAY